MGLRGDDEAMSQVNSTYARQPRDLYETPEWVTRAVMPFIHARVAFVWEPACGSGKMARVLSARYNVHSTDIDTGSDFLLASTPGPVHCDAIITNPPYDQAEQFCGEAIRIMEARGGVVAMLLRVDFDSANGRRHLFANCPAFAKKIVLTKRIVWFVEADGKPKSSPSENHAWFVWDWRHEGAPTLAYAP